jgi:hypothetical protein
MRADVRRALARLGRPRPFLYARYSSAIRQLADAENVLFYNFGTAYFNGLATEEVVLERGFDVVSQFAHENLYTTSASEPMVWSLMPPVCGWELPYTSDSDPSRLVARLWMSMRRSNARKFEDRSLGQPLYAIRLSIQGVTRVNLFAKMKPLLDGVISGMHAYTGLQLPEVGARLARMLGVAPHEIEDLLRGSGPLGPREVVRPYRERVQWNPADDACVHASIQVKAAETEPSISVALHPVVPKQAPTSR